MKNKLLSGFLRFVLVGIGMTCRIRVVSGDALFREIVRQKKSVIFSFWHNRIFFLSFFLYRYCHQKGLPLSVLISQSKDGDFIAGVVHGMKGKTVRGSTSRGGFSAIKGLLRAIKDNYAIVTTPDGPRGPKYEFQVGTIHISSVARVPVVPISCSFASAWVFRSWDNFMIPKPFSRVDVRIAQPLQIPPDLAEKEVAMYQEKLGQVMVGLCPEFIEKR